MIFKKQFITDNQVTDFLQFLIHYFSLEYTAQDFFDFCIYPFNKYSLYQNSLT